MAREKKRGRTSGTSILLVLLLILVGAAGAVGTLLFVTQGKLFGSSKGVQAQEKDDEDRTGKVAVPLSARSLDAYVAVQRDDLYNPQTKSFAVTWVDAEKAKQAGFITEFTAIVGRVMAREKTPGYAFTEADFMPKGTRPGPAAAIESGMRGVWIEPDQVQGLDSLRRGDRFDLMATAKVSARGAGSDARTLAPDAAAAAADRKAWETSKRLLVANGKVVVPLPQDAQKRKGKKIFVQVSEGEVGPLSDALTVNAEIVVFLRSGQPGAGESALPEPPRAPQMDTIEVIQGGKSTLVPVPAGGESKQDG